MCLSASAWEFGRVSHVLKCVPKGATFLYFGPLFYFIFLFISYSGQRLHQIKRGVWCFLRKSEVERLGEVPFRNMGDKGVSFSLVASGAMTMLLRVYSPSLPPVPLSLFPSVWACFCYLPFPRPHLRSSNAVLLYAVCCRNALWWTVVTTDVALR